MPNRQRTQPTLLFYLTTLLSTHTHTHMLPTDAQARYYAMYRVSHPTFSELFDTSRRHRNSWLLLSALRKIPVSLIDLALGQESSESFETNNYVF